MLAHVSVYVRVEPLYEHVPFEMLHERVHDSVPLRVSLLAADVHAVVHLTVAIVHVHEELDALHPPKLVQEP